MPTSMTGYGRASFGNITIDLRSVNHRYLDISVKAPRSFMFLEEPLKTFAQKHISRGKVEILVTVDNIVAETVKITLNHPVLESYLEAAGELAENYGLANDLKVSNALRLPDVISTHKTEPEAEKVTQTAISACELALSDYNAMRVQEGFRISSDILDKLLHIEQITERIKSRMPEIIGAYRERLAAKLSEILEGKILDEAQILTESAIYADKICTDEETVRLESHIASLREMLKSPDQIGRKMDFLVQEFMREANTIGSKANDKLSTEFVVELKSEIEKIREQAQNIE